MLKDLEDVKGDEIFGATTLPLLVGNKNSIYSVVAFLLILTLIIPLPFFLNILSLYYILVAAIADIIFIYVMISMLKSPTKSNAAKKQKVIKYSAMIGLLAFLAGTVPL